MTVDSTGKLYDVYLAQPVLRGVKGIWVIARIGRHTGRTP